jgi:hypothetical protein
MSGPTTVIFETPGDFIAAAAGVSAVILAARAIREARDMHAEYEAAYARVREREAERFEQRRRLREANTQRLAALHGQAERQHIRLARLGVVLAQQTAGAVRLPAVADAPIAQDEQAWLDHLARLEAAIKQVEAMLSAHQGLEQQALGALLSDGADTGEVLAAYARQQARQARMRPEDLTRFQALAQHLLSRLETDPGEAMPVRIERLARELVQAPDVAHAEALATDLRLEIQRANEHRKRQAQDAQDAASLLAALADAIPHDLRATLEQIAAGMRLFDAPTRAIAAALMEEVRAARKREEQEAMAIVLEQSLRDLGYAVEGIAETLFVTGGAAHFQKPAWQNYHVRMRVSPADRSVNFNVVRAQGSGDAALDKKLDYLAEDRWCAAFPALLKTLEARGMKLTVTRQLQAGELPVQVVDAATLPAARAEEEGASAAPRQRYLDDDRR